MLGKKEEKPASLGLVDRLDVMMISVHAMSGKEYLGKLQGQPQTIFIFGSGYVLYLAQFFYK